MKRLLLPLLAALALPTAVNAELVYLECYFPKQEGTNEKNVYELLSPKYFSNKYKKDDFSVPLLYSESSFDNNLFSIPFKKQLPNRNHCDKINTFIKIIPSNIYILFVIYGEKIIIILKIK